jgi:kynurenine formamidase
MKVPSQHGLKNPKESCVKTLKLLDLTHTLHANIPFWDASCGFNIETTLDYGACTSIVKFRVQRINLMAAAGTHMDAPSHCIPSGASIAEIPLQQLEGPCFVVDVSDRASESFSVEPDDILRFETAYGKISPGSWVLVRTGWESRWNNPEAYRNEYRFPSISKEAAEILLQRDVTGLGIDTLSPDRPQDGYPVHQLFLKNGKFIIENVAHSGDLPQTGARLLALPLKIAGGTESPLRLVGIL